MTRQQKLLTSAQASDLARAIAREFNINMTIAEADRDWIPTAIAASHTDGSVTLHIPSRVRLDSLIFEATLYVGPLPPKYRHWQRTANGRPRSEIMIRRQCQKRARGWITARTAFSLEQLAQTRAGRYFARDYRAESLDRRAFDHAEFFRWPMRPFRPAGIVVHVYADDYTLCEELAARHGLIFEPLPISWYYPGGTGAGVYTRAETPIARCA